MTDKNPPDTNPADKTPAAKNPTASGPDDEAFVSDLRASFKADPTPQHRDGFWASLQDELDFEVSSRPEGVVEIQDVKVHEVDPTAWTPAGADELAPRRTRRSGRSSAKPLVGAAAAACLLLVMGGLWLSRTGDRDRTETVSSASQVPDGAAQRSNLLSPDVPVMNRDHWHAPYAFYDCRSGSYLTESVSTLDPLGIHSHQDGVIHIHPFFDASAGKNATFGIFLDSIEATLDGSGLSSLEGSLPAAATCDGEEAVLHLRKWQFDFIIDSAEPEIVVDGIDSVRFENDREVYLLALAPIDGDLPPFPAERLEVLEAVAGGITAVPPAGD